MESPPPPTPIVLVAFGTTQPSGQAAYETLARQVRERFPGHPVQWAFTSTLVQQRLDAPSLAEILASLAEEGHRRVVLQSFHLVPGEQHGLAEAAAFDGLRVIVGAPLMASDRDIQAVAVRLVSRFRAGAANVVVVHGNSRHPEYNRENLRLAELLAGHRPAAVLASLEGEPGTAPLAMAGQFARQTGAVHFLPLLLVAGRHVTHDLLGPHPESWKSRLGVARVTCDPPVALDPPLCEIFFAHLREALAVT